MGLIMYKGFCIDPIQGYSHELLKKPCQDSSDILITNEYAIAAVSDGHGGDLYFRSDIGSKIAVNTSINVIKDFLEDDKLQFLKIIDTKSSKKIEEIIIKLKRKIINTWRIHVHEHYENNKNYSNEERCLINKLISNKKDKRNYMYTLYGATLIVTFITNEFGMILKIGDGECICICNDNIYYPIPKDKNLQFGLTTSLCNSNALNYFNHKFIYYNDLEKINGFILTTDGVVDSYSDNDLKSFSQKIMNEFYKDEEYTKKQLKEWLQKLTKQGSHDDMTISGIFIDK